MIDLEVLENFKKELQKHSDIELEHIRKVYDKIVAKYEQLLKDAKVVLFQAKTEEEAVIKEIEKRKAKVEGKM